MALFNKETNILITDPSQGLIHVCDLNGNLLKSINPDESLQQPVGIMCVGIRKNGIEEIFVSDNKTKTVFVFYQDFNSTKEILNNLEYSNYLTVDFENGILYCLHLFENDITLWNVNDANLIQKLKIERPSSLRISENKIYIVSAVDFKANLKERQLIIVEKGNYISVLNKSNNKLISEIQFDDWFDPQSLHISSDGDIYTIAYELDKNNETWSKNRFLFIIDSTSCQIKQKIELKKLEFIFLIY